MWKWVNKNLMEFRECFRNARAHEWFVVIVVGLMMGCGHGCVTEIVRELNLVDSSYAAMVHFYRAKSWAIEKVRDIWIGIIKKSKRLIKEGERNIMTGDGVKVAKEGKRMPGVKKLHQESENSSKGSYIFGHLFGGLGILAGNAKKKYSILISCRLHDGISPVDKWQGKEEESHVVKMIKDAASAAKKLGRSILLLDRLYLTRPMLETLNTYADRLIEVVTKAKSNVTAYLDPEPYKGRGARPKKGKEVKLWEYFRTKIEEFKTATVMIYGKEKEAKYYSVDMLWGQKLYQRLRFVLTEIEGKRAILVSTDMTIEAVRVIELYSYRFKIEGAFRELKQVVSGLGYRFWSKVQPKLSRYRSNEESQAKLGEVAAPHDRELIESTVHAIDGYVQLGCIALGMLQLIGLLFPLQVAGRFMRTKSSPVPSEASVAHFIRKNIFLVFWFLPKLALTTIIKSRQIPFLDDSDLDVI